MKSGFLPKDGKKAPDEIIAGSERDPAALDAEPEAVAAE
jgi:hypothetical protein